MAVRDRSKAFLEPWEPAWPRDALTPGAYRRRLHRVEQEWRSGVGYGFFIVDDGTDDLLGGITLANVRRGVVESANVGYWIAEQHARQGYMSEAIQVLLDFAFCKLNLHRVEAACLVHNHDTFGILRTDDRPAVPVIES